MKASSQIESVINGTVLFKLVVAVLFVILLLLQYRLWFAPGNILETRQLQLRLDQQMATNQQQLEKNEALKSEVNALKSDLSEVEARARKDLGMVKPDETFFMLVDPAESRSPPRKRSN